MKKTIGILAACILMLFAGCGAPSAPQPADGSPGKKLKVCTSFYAMYDFAKKVGGDKIDVVNLVPAGTEPHDWEPSASDVVSLERADVLVYNGAGMESWVEKVLGSLENKKLAAVEASKGISLIRPEEDGRESRDDPHVWLDPENAKTELKNIRDALIGADAANRSTYEQNYEKSAARFDGLDAEYRDAAAKLPNKSIVVSHQAFGYLCRAYGLTQVPIEGLSADTEPDPKRMSEIIGFVKENSIRAIFFEDLVSPKVAESIASQTGAKAVQFNPLEGLTEEEQAKGEDYVSVMEQNLNVLKEALQ